MKRRIVSFVALLCAVILAASFMSCGKNKKNKETETYPNVYVETGDPIVLDEIPLED